MHYLPNLSYDILFEVLNVSPLSTHASMSRTSKFWEERMRRYVWRSCDLSPLLSILGALSMQRETLPEGIDAYMVRNLFIQHMESL